jgi:small-conductance mechanosensitive channel
MRRLFYVIVIAVITIFFGTCKTTDSRHIAPDVWSDATLVAEQRAIIERQREYISDLERIIQTGANNLRNAEERLGSLEDGNIEFANWLQRVDKFVRAVIAEQRRLEQVQFANSGTDAGER